MEQVPKFHFLNLTAKKKTLIYICYESFHYIILFMADFEIFSELCAYQSLKKMRGNNEKRGWVTQVDRAATWHRTEEEKLLMMIKIFCVKIQR